MSYFKKILAAGFIILVVVFGFLYKFRNQEKIPDDFLPEEEKSSTQELPITETKKIESAVKLEETKNEEKKDLPGSVLIDVPFLVQAPNGIWDALHEDACEEASIIMLKHFLDKENIITPAQGEKEILELVKFEEKNGFGKSITIDELGELVKKYYKIENYRVEKNIKIEDLKKELADGRPVIIPAAGKILPNPNFKDGGPLYHMLVIVGYDQKGFITNDPGTRKGEGFRYAFEDLYSAIHDWNGGQVLSGQKTYLVFD